MKERKEASALDMVGLLATAIILFFILGYGLSIYESIKVDNELNHRQQTQKVEINKRLFDTIFEERKIRKC